MTILDRILGQTNYQVKAKCTNCGTKGVKDVPKGITAKEYFQTPQGACKVCGLNTVEVKNDN